MSRLYIVFTLFCLVMSAYGGTRDPAVPDSKYIEYGSEFVYVGRICGVYDNGEKFCASAVAIDDHNILTAAHVIMGASSCKFYLADQEFCINEIIIHKDFDTNKYGTADIAIGYCDKSFGLKFYPALYSNDDEVGSVCSLSGYGLTGTFNTGAYIYDNQRRAGSNVIDRSEEDLLICSPSKSHEKRRTSLEFLIASGDSGGGLFIGNRLAGINSCIMAVDKAPASKYNEESGHTRISKFIPWINKHKK